MQRPNTHSTMPLQLALSAHFLPDRTPVCCSFHAHYLHHLLFMAYSNKRSSPCSYKTFLGSGSRNLYLLSSSPNMPTPHHHSRAQGSKWILELRHFGSKPSSGLNSGCSIQAWPDQVIQVSSSLQEKGKQGLHAQSIHILCVLYNNSLHDPN